MSRLVSDDGQTVAIEVGIPIPLDGGGAECGYRIDGHAACAHGSDELAALYRALVEIGALLARANHDPNRARFVAPAELGFPGPSTDHLPAPDGLGEVVATRMIDRDGQRYTVSIGRPVRTGGQELALCPFQVDHRPRAVAGGWDGIQALLTAIAMIGAWL